MPFMHMLPDPGMNYTFNRPLLDGTSPARLKELSAIAPRIKDYDTWHTVWLEVARKAEAEKRWADAASYYHGAEFYLPAGDARNALYDDFARNWARPLSRTPVEARRAYLSADFEVPSSLSARPEIVNRWITALSGAQDRSLA
jgi:hypothetical protein